jgi:hypothetical protein
MKERIKKLRTFLTFDTPLEMNNIGSLFSTTHSQYQQLIPEWSYSSTRQKMIGTYWFSQVVAHFAAMTGIALLISWTVIRHFEAGYLLVVLIVGFFYFIVQLVASYWPSYISNFLPKLEAVMSKYQYAQQQKVIRQLQQELTAYQEQARKEQERIIEQFQTQLSAQQEQADQQCQYFQIQLQGKLAEQQTRLLKQQEAIQNRFQQKISLQKEKIEQQQEAIKKCRQAQLSNFALTLIYYAFAKTAGSTSIENDDHTANLLLKLYGVDRGSLRTNLDLIAGSGSKRKNLGERKYTEIRNRFEEAISFFNEMDFPRGVLLLKELELKFVRAQKNEFDKV